MTIFLILLLVIKFKVTIISSCPVIGNKNIVKVEASHVCNPLIFYFNNL